MEETNVITNRNYCNITVLQVPVL